MISSGFLYDIIYLYFKWFKQSTIYCMNLYVFETVLTVLGLDIKFVQKCSMKEWEYLQNPFNYLRCNSLHMYLVVWPLKRPTYYE